MDQTLVKNWEDVSLKFNDNWISEVW
jgi:hypothetical protein